MQLLKMLSCFAVVFTSVQPWSEVFAQVPDALHQQCLKAADYQGCVKANSPIGTQKDEQSSGGGVDRFGLPVLDAKRYEADSTNGTGDTDYYTDLSSYRMLLNRGKYGRYVAWEVVVRKHVEGTAGTSGYSVPVVGARTNCFGSAYGGTHGGYGSSNCYTSPGLSMQVPGKTGMAAGPRQITITTVLDCVDRTFQAGGKGRWKNWSETKSTTYFESVCKEKSAYKKGEEIS
jgi:hypothetical protein